MTTPNPSKKPTRLPKTQPAKGATQSAAEFYHRVKIDECLYTDNFEVTDACISCGHCEDICPAYAIKLNEEGIPTWVNMNALCALAACAFVLAKLFAMAAHNLLLV